MTDEKVIVAAWRRLRKGKTKRQEVKEIEADFDNQVKFMQDMIRNTLPENEGGERRPFFTPAVYKAREVCEGGKRRVIYAPNIREQWLHHIIMRVLEPVFMRGMYRFSCGSVPGRGVHYGRNAVERFIKHSEPRAVKYFIKADIRHFYNSTRHDVLFKRLAATIKDERLLYVLRLCLGNFKKGLPLGFYISQWLANFILSDLDKMVSTCFKGYFRYMDDLVIFGANKKQLKKLLAMIKKELGGIRLRLKRNYQVCRFDYVKKSGITGRPVDFLGFRFYRNRCILRKRVLLAATRLAGRIFKRKRAGRGLNYRQAAAMVSYLGWFRWSDTYAVYLNRIKPFVNAGRLKKYISKVSKRKAAKAA